MRFLTILLLLLAQNAFAAFPQIGSTSQGEFSAGINGTATMPATVNANDLLILCVSIDGNQATVVTGWTELFDQQSSSNSVTGSCWAKDAVGDEDGTSVTVSWEPNTQNGSYIATTWTGTNDGGPASVSCTAQSNTSSANHDAPSHTAAWGTEDNTWFATLHNDFTQTVTAYPLASNQLNEPHSSGGGAGTGFSSTESAVATLDPGNYTTNSGTGSVTATCSIRPTAPAVTGGYWFNRRHN